MSTPDLLPRTTVKRTIESLFSAMYHGKRSFADFAHASVTSNFDRQVFTRAGKTREILVPSEKLKGCHEFIRLFLLDFLPINEDVVFSYRKGLSSFDAVEKHSKSKSFFTCDIADFFPSLNRSRIESTLLTAREACPIENLDSWIGRILDLVCVDDALPMGFSTSPSISNAALRTFDDALHKFCKNRDLILTRYSDDIIISGKSLSALSDIEYQVTKLLRESTQGELTLNTKKSKFLHSGIKIKLLGMVLLPNGTISVDSSFKSEIEVLIHFYQHDKSKFVDRIGGDLQKAESRLSGLLNYVNTVDQGYLDKLRKKFGVTVVDYFLHRSFM